MTPSKVLKRYIALKFQKRKDNFKCLVEREEELANLLELRRQRVRELTGVNCGN